MTFVLHLQQVESQREFWHSRNGFRKCPCKTLRYAGCYRTRRNRKDTEHVNPRRHARRKKE